MATLLDHLNENVFDIRYFQNAPTKSDSWRRSNENSIFRIVF